MDTTRWTKVKTLLAEAIGMSPETRQAYLLDACADDAGLLQEINELLDAHEQTGKFDQLSDQMGAIQMGAIVSRSLADKAKEGEQVGPYRLVRELGRGGMGIVFLADREDEHFSQQTALKVLHNPLGSRQVHNRFLNERQILAQLNHPNIARLFDGGVTADGTPYLVMEYIEGEPIDTYSDSLRLTIPERLNMFVDVCTAVHFAHQNLVIHRDLKPGNILISAEGQVKLLDFGIAKLLEDNPLYAGDQTLSGMHLMTPSYASPEQVSGQAVSTASDVYALGVILYELLTGSRPHDLKKLSPSEIERTICEKPPTKPSTLVLQAEKSGTAQYEQHAHQRRLSLLKLGKTLNGDLDTIVLKALQKEPERRYASAEQFAEDIRRYLADKPVQARPDTIRYRTRKFVRRHKGVVTTVGLTLAALLVAFGITLWQMNVARFERNRAALGEEKAERVVALIVDSYKSLDPATAGTDTLSAARILDNGVKRAETELADQPETQATMFDVLSRSYSGLGLYEPALDLSRRSLALRLKNQAPASEIAESQHLAGRMFRQTGDLDSAAVYFQKAVDTHRRTPVRADSAYAVSLHSLGDILRIKEEPDAARAYLDEAITLFRQRYGDKHHAVATVLIDLGAVAHDKRDYAEAEQIFKEAVEIYHAFPNMMDARTADALEDLGKVFLFKRNYEQARPLLEEVLAIRQRIYGDSHPEVINSIYALGNYHYNTGNLVAADTLFTQARALGVQVMGADHVEVALYQQGLHLLQLTLEQFDVALDRQRFVTEGLAERLGADHARVFHARLVYGDGVWASGDHRLALDLFEQLYADILAAHPDGHPYSGRALYGLAAAKTSLGMFAAAEADLQQAMTFFTRTMRPDHPYITSGNARYAAFLAASTRYDEANPLYEEVISKMQANSVAPDFFLARQQFLFGEMLLLMEKHDAAASNLQAAVDAMEQALPAGHRHTARAWVALGEALVAQRKFVQAAHYLTLATTHLANDTRETTRYTHARELLERIDQYAR